MDVEAVIKETLTVAGSLAALIGVGSRNRRLRNEIRENLALVTEIEKSDVLREHTPAAGWLQSRIALDVAKLSGTQLGVLKKPIAKGAVAVAAVLAAAFGFWTYWINRDGFSWYSVAPGTITFLMFISIFGQFMNRELPPDDGAALPPGAVAVRSETASEQVATAVTLATSAEGLDQRYEPHGQIGVVLRFVRLMQQGRVEEGFNLTDSNWLRCRIQAWLWSHQTDFGEDVTVLEAVAQSLKDTHAPSDVWSKFVRSESSMFSTAWGSVNLDGYGAASRRRRIGRDFDLVILAPLGGSGGYFVITATVIPNAMPFVVHRRDHQWLVAAHVGAAPPVPGWPPTWWSSDDPAVEALPED
jgi:hypothetical protein